MGPQMLQESRYILASRRGQDRFPAVQKFGKGLQIAVLGLARKRPQPLLNTKICLVILQETEVACSAHTFDYPRVSR